MKRILVTGASGFVGTAVCAGLLDGRTAVRRALRTLGQEGPPAGVEDVVVGTIDKGTSWSDALTGIEAVVHLAARVHVMRDDAADPLEEYRRINVDGTEHLAREATARGVKRLVFVSSAKVHGEATHGTAFREEDLPRPSDAYAQSKWEAEQVLRRVMDETGLEVVVLRPPLVYGPGVKANFLRLMEAVAHGIPLPLRSVRNRRSLVYVENLADAVAVATQHPAAAGETFLVSDGTAVSTPDLLREMAAVLQRPSRLVPVPPAMLEVGARLLGRSAAVERLCGSLVIDSGKITRCLDWTPPFSLSEGLRKTADWFRERH